MKKTPIQIGRQLGAQVMPVNRRQPKLETYTDERRAALKTLGEIGEKIMRDFEALLLVSKRATVEEQESNIVYAANSIRNAITADRIEMRNETLTLAAEIAEIEFTNKRWAEAYKTAGKMIATAIKKKMTYQRDSAPKQRETEE